MASSMLSPATKRVVSFLNNPKLVAKSLSPSWRDSQIRALLVIICDPSLWYPWRRLSPTNQGGAFCTPASNEGTCADAIEARGDCFIAGGSCRRGFVHCARARCLLKTSPIKPGPARPIYFPVASGHHHLRIDLRLSPHRASPAITGFSDCGPGRIANHLAVHPDFDPDSAQRSRRPGAACWTTNRRLIADCRFGRPPVFAHAVSPEQSGNRQLGPIQSNLFLYRAQRIDDETDVFVHIDAQLFDALPDVVAIHRTRERLVLELLLD